MTRNTRRSRGLPSEMPETLQPGRLRRRLAHLAAVVAVVGIVVATFPGLGQVRHHLTNAQPAWLIVAVAAELASALSYVVCLRAVFCPCMRWAPSCELGMSELAAGGLLPAGGAGGRGPGARGWGRGGGGAGARRLGVAPRRHVERSHRSPYGPVLPYYERRQLRGRDRGRCRCGAR